MWRAKTGGFGDQDGADRSIGFGHDYGDTIGFLAAPRAPDALPYVFDRPAAPPPGDPLAAPRSPNSAKEVAFINGITANGKITDTSFWHGVGVTAYKWGESTAGTGATITYSFDKESHFTATEKATFLKAFAMWSSIADVTFKQVANDAGVLLTRGHDGGAYNSTPTTSGQGAQLGQVAGQATISIDTSVFGFDLSGAFDRVGGYGLSTVIHEVGHLLGLGHGGAYNGSVNADTDQFSAFDDRQYTIMSYISYRNTDAKYAASNPNPGTDWGFDSNGYPQQAPHTAQELDIIAIQQLYGAADKTPLSGGQTYGFHSNIRGPLHDFFDFTVNTHPIVTIFNEGANNTLDLSGYSQGQVIDLRPGAFSSVGGMANNVAIAFGTDIATGIGGSGDDTLIANGVRNVLVGGGGADAFTFHDGDTGKTAKTADEIKDFRTVQHDHIDLRAIDADSRTTQNDAFIFIGTDRFSHHAGELRFVTIHGNVFVSGDTDGDAKADFMIRVDGLTTIAGTDFNL